MKLLHLLTTALLSLLFLHLIAQETTAPATLTAGRVLTTDGEKITFSKLKADGNGYEYVDKKSGKKIIIESNKVLGIEKVSGDRALGWGLMGAGSGLLGSLQGVNDINNTHRAFGQESVDGGPIILGLTVGFGLVGAIIGSGNKKYKTVYTNPAYGHQSSKPDVHFILVSSPMQGAGIGLRYRL